MARVRQANVLTGDEGPQGPRHLCLNFSTSPHRRKRAILAGKIKRAVLEAGGQKINLKLSSPLRRFGFVGRKLQGVEQRHTPPLHKSGADGWMKMPWLACWGRAKWGRKGAVR